MQVIHFTEGATDLLWGFRAEGTRFVPLADGDGDVHVSCLHLLPGAFISEPPVTHDCAVLIVHGYVVVVGDCRLDLYAGVGFVVNAGERYSLESSEGAILIVAEPRSLEATSCGRSTPQRIMGQRWPGDPGYKPRT
jgi:hypothetical protein